MAQSEFAVCKNLHWTILKPEREFRILVLNLSGGSRGAHRTAQEKCGLDNTFALIEGHPSLGLRLLES